MIFENLFVLGMIMFVAQALRQTILRDWPIIFADVQSHKERIAPGLGTWSEGMPGAKHQRPEMQFLALAECFWQADSWAM